MSWRFFFFVLMPDITRMTVMILESLLSRVSLPLVTDGHWQSCFEYILILRILLYSWEFIGRQTRDVMILSGERASLHPSKQMGSTIFVIKGNETSLAFFCMKEKLFSQVKLTFLSFLLLFRFSCRRMNWRYLRIGSKNTRQISRFPTS